MTTPSIREKFDKARYKMYQEKGIDVSPKDIAIWAFLEGMREAARLASENEHTGVFVENAIMRAIKEFKDEHPK